MASLFKSVNAVFALSKRVIFHPSASSRLFTGSARLSSSWNQGIPTASGQRERPSTESLIKWNKLPVPKAPPKDRWIPKKALFGENDYKDLLGDGSYPLHKNVKTGPFWLRGWKGNEYERLLRKRKWVGADLGPKAKHDMNKQIKYLYKKYNRNMGRKYLRSNKT